MHPLVGKPWENHHASRLLRPTPAGSLENAESRQTHDVRDPPFRLFPTIRLLVTLGAQSLLGNPRATPRLFSAIGPSPSIQRSPAGPRFRRSTGPAPPAPAPPIAFGEAVQLPVCFSRRSWRRRSARGHEPVDNVSWLTTSEEMSTGRRRPPSRARPQSVRATRGGPSATTRDGPVGSGSCDRPQQDKVR
jgi:hypothetical protein